VAGAGDVGLGVLAEFCEEFMDAGDGGLVAFDFAGPAAFGGVLDELFSRARRAWSRGAYSLVVKNFEQRR
jgi:hypothetical protein